MRPPIPLREDPLVLHRLLGRIQTLILDRPGLVLALTGVSVVVAALLGATVELRTSRSELAPADDPDQQRWSELVREYRGSEAIIACVEPIDPTKSDSVEQQRFTDRLAREFLLDPRVESVFHKVDVGFFESHALHLVPAEQLAQAVEALEGQRALWTDLNSLTDLERFNTRLARELAAGFEQASAPPPEAAESVARLADLLAAQRQLLERPNETVDAWLQGSPFEALAGDRARELGDGYLKTRDGAIYFVYISPVSVDDSLAERRQLLGALRDRAGEAVAQSPGFRVAFTGQAALVVDEMNTVRSDTWRTSAIAFLGVSLLTMFVFRWRSHALLVLGALAVGIIWSLGAVKLELGYLNMITSSFISTLVGIGVAYGIHPLSEYELAGAHTGDARRNIILAFQNTGAGVLVAAITTSAAFFSIQLMRFRGFSELGLVAGVGVLLCFTAAVVCLPAMLGVFAAWRQRRGPTRARPATVVDRLWIEPLASRICRYPRTVLLGAGLLTLGAAWAATHQHVDTNIMDLLPRNAESLRYQHKMVMASDLSPLFNLVVADDIDEMKAMRERALEESSVARFDSLLDFVPEDPAATEASLGRLRQLLSEVRLPEATRPIDRAGLAAALWTLESALADATDAAFSVGLADLVGPLEEARAEAESSAQFVDQADAASVEAWNVAQQSLLRRGVETLEWLRDSAATEAPSATNLPAGLAERFRTTSGRLIGLVHPAGSVFERERLDEFVAASRRIDAEATGFPQVFHKMSQRIRSGFQLAVLVGALLVVAILIVDYRNVFDAALALFPLAVGIVWMMGGMTLLNVHFNFANLVAVPLIIGVGIDNGVHMIHRVRLEGAAGISVVLRHTSRAIVIASLTTMIGFGSLAAASHRGMASLGFVLLLGVGSCLITSTIVLPNLLVLIGRAPSN